MTSPIYDELPFYLGGADNVPITGTSIYRDNAVAAVAPTEGEFPTPDIGDIAVVWLNNGTREVWKHSGTAWVLELTIAPGDAKSTLFRLFLNMADTAQIAEVSDLGVTAVTVSDTDAASHEQLQQAISLPTGQTRRIVFDVMKTSSDVKSILRLQAGLGGDLSQITFEPVSGAYVLSATGGKDQFIVNNVIDTSTAWRFDLTVPGHDDFTRVVLFPALAVGNGSATATNDVSTTGALRFTRFDVDPVSPLFHGFQMSITHPVSPDGDVTLVGTADNELDPAIYASSYVSVLNEYAQIFNDGDLFSLTGDGRLLLSRDATVYLDGYIDVEHSVNNATVGVVFTVERASVVTLTARAVHSLMPNAGNIGHISGNGFAENLQAGDIVGLAMASDKSGTVHVHSSTITARSFP